MEHQARARVRAAQEGQATDDKKPDAVSKH
jgi:hypothetical protein